MTLPKSLTTVTPFSKGLAVAIFILFPILTFFLGMTHQESMMNIKIAQLEKELNQTSRSPTPTPDYTDTANWKTYIDSKLNYQIKYPQTWTEKTSNEESTRTLSLTKGDENIIISEGGSRGFDGPYETKYLKVGNENKSFFYYSFDSNLSAYNGGDVSNPENKKKIGFLIKISKSQEAEEKDEVEKILSTFKFLDQ